MAQPKIPSVSESASDMLSALHDYYPGLAGVYRQELLPTAQAELATSQAVSPQYQQLISDLYKQFGPGLATTGAQVDDISRKAAAKTDVDILKSSGGDLARTYSDIDKSINPEYYATRTKTANALEDLLGSINLSDPNPEAERLISQENARSGNLAQPSATTTVANALSFGSEADKRRNSLEQAINSATAFLGNSSTAANFNPATTILNRPTSNTGQSNFAGANTTAGSSANQASQNFTSGLTQLQSNYANNQANKRDAVDRINEGFSSL